MGDLLDLARGLEEPKPEKQPLVVSIFPTKSQITRGDDALDQADVTTGPTTEEQRVANLFKQSYGILNAKMQENEAYANHIGPELQKRVGDFKSYMDLVIDEADKERIRLLQQERPEWFTSKEAAVNGFLNEATFGQLSKLYGKAGELIGDRPYADVVSEKADQFRLLSKAFPGWSTLGGVSAYLVPGSPAKMLFSSMAKLGEKAAFSVAAKSLLAKLAGNPQLLQSIVKGAAVGGMGAGAVGATRGALGTDLQGASLDRAVNEGLMSAIGGTVAGGAIPAAGYGLAKGAAAANRGLGRLVQEFTGTAKESLLAYNKNPAVIRSAAEKGAEGIGEELARVVDDVRFTSQFKAAAQKVLPWMPDVDGRALVARLKGVQKTNNPALDRAVSILNEWGNRFEAQLKKNGKVSASTMAQWKEELQQAVETYGQDLGGTKAERFFRAQIHNAGREARLIVEGAADKLAKMSAKKGDTIGVQRAQSYVENMRHAAREARIVKSVAEMLGKSPEARAAKAESFIERVFGKNRAWQRQRLAQLDAISGAPPENGILAQAENFWHAKQLGGPAGPQGSPSWFNTTPTGRSVLGLGLGAAAGAANQVMGGDPSFNYQTGGLAGAVASSPRVGAMVLGASGAITGFLQKMFVNPAALNAVASGKNGVAPEIQKIAKEVQSTMAKDGPKSAASLVRHIADTPFYAGLVHYFDLAERRTKLKEAGPEAARQMGY